MFEDSDAVTVAMPFGSTGKVEIWTTKKDALTEKWAKKTLKTKKGFKFVALKRTKTAAPAKKKKAKAKKAI